MENHFFLHNKYPGQYSPDNDAYISDDPKKAMCKFGFISEQFSKPKLQAVKTPILS